MIPMRREMIPLRWSNSGPENERNAFGTIIDKESGNAIICTHGGSQWLCESCAQVILQDKVSRDKVVRK